jgi:3-dehydroquinate dehydratase-1
MLNVNIRGCVVGEGRPKVVVSIVERDESTILQRAAQFAQMPIDIVEWRADWYSEATDANALRRCLRALREALGETPLLVTFRTKAEGGERAVTQAEYVAICRAICSSGCADAIDLEYFTAGDDLPALIEAAHAVKLEVICSNHDFSATPSQKEMVRRMMQMQRAGADIAKLAVMPQTRSDVLALLTATVEMVEFHASTPVVTMSMGKLGAVTRLCGETFGSALTFASVGRASAPGQMDLDTLNTILDALHA